MGGRLLMTIIALLGLWGCAPVMIGLTAGQIASTVVMTVVQVQQLRELRGHNERQARTNQPGDFLNVGDPSSKALARLGKPASKEAREDGTHYLFPGQRLVADTGEVVERDLQVLVDRQEKIAAIIIREPAATASAPRLDPSQASGGTPPETG